MIECENCGRERGRYYSDCYICTLARITALVDGLPESEVERHFNPDV